MLRMSRGVVLAAVVVAPWLFGCADPWAYLPVCLLVGVGVAGWLASVACSPGAKVRAPLLTAALLLLAAFVLVQTLPLSPRLVKAVSPLSAEARTAQQGLFGRIGAEEFLPADLQDRPESMSISASPGATRRSLYLLAAYIGVFLVMSNAFTKWPQIRRAAVFLAITSFLMAVLALMQKFSGTREIFWFYHPRYGGDIFGPFTNQNHFAGHMNMAFGLTLGLLFVETRGWARGAYGSWRERLARLSRRQTAHMVLLGFAAGLVGATVCVTLSRGGIISLATSLCLLGVVVALRRPAVGRWRVPAAVALVALAAVLWLGWQPVMARLGSLAQVAEDPLGDLRAVAARDTLRIFEHAPVAGCGFGTFQHVFPSFQSRAIQIGRWLHAHNDYVQLLAEGGVTGALLAALAGLLFLMTLRARLPKAAAEGRLLAHGLSVGILAVALHGLVDYGLHKPGNAVLFSALCGMAVAAAHLHRPQRRRKTRRVRADVRKQEAKPRAYAEAAAG